MKIAICDDEKKDLERIHKYCVSFDPTIATSLFSSGAELLDAFDDDFFDLVFLDIEMAAPNGLAVGAALAKRNPRPIIIFTTQSPNYAVRGYGIALRYLPKPIEYETFVGAVRLAMEKIISQKITICNHGEQIVVSINDISYLEVIHHELIIHLKNRKTISTHKTLSEMQVQLSHHGFSQPHKSYCVNLDHVDRVSRQTVTMTNGELIPIGRSKSERFQAELDLFLRGNRAL